MFILSFLFFLTAILYSSVGFGGGSTYLASFIDYGVFPTKFFLLLLFVVILSLFQEIVLTILELAMLTYKVINTLTLFGSIPLAFIRWINLRLDKNIFEIILLFIVLFLAGSLLN